MKPINYTGYFLFVICISQCHGQTAARYTISTLAGTGGAPGYAGDGGAATTAQLSNPTGVAVNASLSVFIADSANYRVRQVTADGGISTAAGSATRGYAGDGGAAASAQLSNPNGIGIDSAGNIYITDSGSHIVRKVTTGGTISTVAGNSTSGAGFSGDGAAATAAQLNKPVAVAVDSAGNLYIVDLGNHRIRKVGADGNISTFAGNGNAGYSGDGGVATAASLNTPWGVALDGAGNVYIGDKFNHRVRKVSPAGTISTVAGTGKAGYSGDYGRATDAQLNYPSGVAIDTTGNLYIVDNANSRIRRVTPSGVISTIAGNGRHAYAGDGGLATSASLFFPTAIALDTIGNVYVADSQSAVIRLLTPQADSSLPPKISAVVGPAVFGGSTAVAPGSWIEIYGSDLAVSARSWSNSDFINQTAPTMLDGTTVTIGGQPAAISYVSGGQINALVPTSLGPGTQTLTVTSLVGTSEPAMLLLDATKPAMYAPPVLNIGGRQYAGAVFTDGVTFVAPPGVAGGIRSRPARAGEQIVFSGIGFGPVLPNVPFGRVVQQSNAITGSLQIFFGGTPATLAYAGMAPGTVGLYQFNVIVPNLEASDAVPMRFTFNGVDVEQTLVVAVQN